MFNYFMEYTPNTITDANEIIRLIETKLHQEVKLKKKMRQCDELLKENIIIFKNIFDFNHKINFGPSEASVFQSQSVTNITDTRRIKTEYTDTDCSEFPIESIDCLETACLKINELKCKLFHIDDIKEISKTLKQNIIVLEKMICDLLIDINVISEDVSFIQVGETKPQTHLNLQIVQDNVNDREKHTELLDNSTSGEDTKISEAQNNYVPNFNLFVKPEETTNCFNYSVNYIDVNKSNTIQTDSPNMHEKQFSCDICGVKFPSYYRKKMHKMEIHKEMNDYSKELVESKNIRINAARKFNNEYVCGICDKVFSSFINIRTHILYIHKKSYVKVYENKFSCDICNEKFPSRYRRLVHKRNIHMKTFPTKQDIIENKKIRINAAQAYHNQYICDICHKTFAEFKKIGPHMRFAHHPKILKCKICDAKFSIASHLRKHEILHINKEARGTIYICDICSSKFYTKSGLVYHMIKHNPNTPFKCKICNKLLSRKAYLNYHMMTQHGIGKPFKCDECERSFTILSTLKQHKNQSHNKNVIKNKEFICEICGLAFVTNVSLTQHRKTHLNERYSCSNCSKQFGNKQSLYIHTRKNHADKLLKCDVCNRNYANIQRLRLHKCLPETQITEIQKDKLTCDICNKQFLWGSNLSRHKLIHQVTKQFKCNICLRYFAQKNTLKFHLEVHAGLKPYARRKI